MNDDLKNLLKEGTEELEGAFFKSLKRNNKEIKEARAITIAEEARTTFKRKIEDLANRVKFLRREQENILDMSPTNTQSLILAADFKPDEYIANEIKLATEIRNTSITLELAINRYNYLFGRLTFDSNSDTVKDEIEQDRVE